MVKQFFDLEPDKREESFYGLCADDKNASDIKQLIASPLLKRELLSLGLFSAIKQQQPEIRSLLLNAIKTRNTEMGEFHRLVLFNVACSTKTMDVVEYLEEKYSLIQQYCSENLPVTRDKSGQYKVSYHPTALGGFRISRPELDMRKLNINPLQFCLNEGNEEMVDMMLKKMHGHVHPSLVEGAFISHCRKDEQELKFYSKDSDIKKTRDAIVYMVMNDTMRQLLLNSPIVTTFLNDEKQVASFKKEALIALEMVSLTKVLPTSTTHARKNKL